MCDIIVISEGFSILKNKEEMKANCSCTLVKGLNNNIIVDTMTAWDADKIISVPVAQPLSIDIDVGVLWPISAHNNQHQWHWDAFIKIFPQKKSTLKKQNIRVDDINYVVSTHGHSDHIGNNNLFLTAKHIVGFSVSYKDNYYLHPFDEGQEFIIEQNVKVIPTPGHTLSDVTVLAISTNKETVAITGDLFEKFEDIEDPSIWREAGSEDPIQQKKNRWKISQMADWIVPGHGPMFRITNEVQESLKKQIDENVLK